MHWVGGELDVRLSENEITFISSKAGVFRDVMDETFKLPWELVQDIFSFLDLASLASICLVAKYYILSLLFVNSNSHIRSWHRIGRRKELWRRFQRPVLFLRRRKSSLDIFSTETQTLDSFPDTTWSIE